MEKVKGTGKRGRPRKNPIKPVETGPKRKRGRPSKNKKITEDIESTVLPVVEEVYVEPKLLRKKRVFKFDKSLFHTFSHKFGGDIIKLSYIINELMKLYIDDKLSIDKKSYSNEFYIEWCKKSPPIEPLTTSSISQENAVLRGIPLQYKYPLIIEESTFYAFERSTIKKGIYSQFVLNKLLQMYLDEKNKTFIDKNIDINKAKMWCNL